MVSAGRHPKNAINQALRSLDKEYFEVIEVHHGHRWGAVRCRFCGKATPIWSSPRVPEDNADDIDRFAKAHRH